MAESSKKSLAVLKYLWENTDTNRQATTTDIIEGVKEYGVSLDRHSLPEICEELKSIGLNVICRKSSPNRYYIGSRQLDLPEIKLLIDAVDTAGFISSSQSKELINKIIDLSAPSSKKELKRHVYTDGRPKSECDELFRNVDMIHNALKDNMMISFQYYEYNSQKKRIHKHGKDYFYKVSPYALVWNDDYYYVLGYCEQHNNISKFRVDRIDNIRITDIYSKRKPKDFNPVAHWYMFNIIICKTTNSHQGTLYYMLWWELYAFKMIFDFFVKMRYLYRNNIVLFIRFFHITNTVFFR